MAVAAPVYVIHFYVNKSITAVNTAALREN